MLGNETYEFEGEGPETLSMCLRNNGYQTALVGKSHMVGAWDRAGFEHIRYCNLTDGDRHDILTNHYFKYLVDNGIADKYEDGSLPPEHPYSKNEWNG